MAGRFDKLFVSLKVEDSQPLAFRPSTGRSRRGPPARYPEVGHARIGHLRRRPGAVRHTFGLGGAGVIPGLRIIVLGKQGSGKGTQSQQLAQRLAVPHISTGDMLRPAVRGDSTTAREVKAVMDAGELISDQLVFDLVAERLAAADARHRAFVLDGFPRSVDQAKQLFSLLGDDGLDAAVTLDVPSAEVIRRLSARRVCLSCGRNYQVAQTPQLNEWTYGSCRTRRPTRR